LGHWLEWVSALWLHSEITVQEVWFGTFKNDGYWFHQKSSWIKNYIWLRCVYLPSFNQSNNNATEFFRISKLNYKNKPGLPRENAN